jgi:hypothetical protein
MSRLVWREGFADAFRREQDKPGYKPGLWACMTGSLIIVVIVIVTDTYFYFCNKKQARGELIIEPVEGTDSSVSLLSRSISRRFFC